MKCLFCDKPTNNILTLNPNQHPLPICEKCSFRANQHYHIRVANIGKTKICRTCGKKLYTTSFGIYLSTKDMLAKDCHTCWRKNYQKRYPRPFSFSEKFIKSEHDSLKESAYRMSLGIIRIIEDE